MKTNLITALDELKDTNYPEYDAYSSVLNTAIEDVEFTDKQEKIIINGLLYLKSEEWRPVKGYEGLYEVSNYGRVRSFLGKKVKILKPYEADRGHIKVTLHNNSGYRRLFVHRLVLEAFKYDEMFPGCVSMHINHNPKDNRATNLKWGTQKENMMDTDGCITISLRNRKIRSLLASLEMEDYSEEELEEIRKDILKAYGLA